VLVGVPVRVLVLVGSVVNAESDVTTPVRVPFAVSAMVMDPAVFGAPLRVERPGVTMTMTTYQGVVVDPLRMTAYLRIVVRAGCAARGGAMTVTCAMGAR